MTFYINKYYYLVTFSDIIISMEVCRMQIKNQDDIELLLLGSDINTYYMARNYHEAYNKKAYVIGKQPMKFTSYSKILNLKIEPSIQERDVFRKILESFAIKHKGKKIILIGTNDAYVRLIVENQFFLKKYYLFTTINEELLNNLLIKDKFYSYFSHSNVNMPKTYIYNINDEIDKKEVDKLNYPIILKPGNGVDYHNHEFETQAKVYKIYSFNKLVNIINEIKKSQYSGNLIIQEFIPGDDSNLFDVVFFCDHTKKVKLMTFAQIGLQEHTKSGIGNATVLVNNFSSKSNYNDIIDNLKKFINSLEYHGFGEIDLKYNSNNDKYYILEINPRQARSSYYLTKCGFNIVEYIINDLLYKKDLQFQFIKNQVCISFVPKFVIKKYLKDKKLKKKIFELVHQKKYFDPLNYKKDFSLKRSLWLTLRKINYIKKYKNNNW